MQFLNRGEAFLEMRRLGEDFLLELRDELLKDWTGETDANEEVWSCSRSRRNSRR
jgi:hypothetical protein